MKIKHIEFFHTYKRKYYFILEFIYFNCFEFILYQNMLFYVLFINAWQVLFIYTITK